MGFIEDLQKYQKGNKKQYNMADLNALVDQVNDQLLCDDGCQRQKEIDKLKKKYNSHKLTCLHKNSLDKQQFPSINLIRQILKCNKLKLKPKIICKGYCKITNKKIFERNFIIVQLD